MTQPTQVTTKPSSRACLACRGRHLRCDGGSPSCIRCLETREECVYVRSKRGLRKSSTRPTRSSRPAPSLPLDPISATVPSPTSVSLSDSPHDPMPTPMRRSNYPTQLFDSSSMTHSMIKDVAHVPRSRAVTDETKDPLVDMYYRAIHSAHPFLLPRNLYQQYRTILPDYLTTAMRYLACHHTSTDPEQYRRQLDEIYDLNTQDSGFKVQALLLLTIASYARFERDAGNKALSTAIEVATRINLNSSEFAPNDAPIFQESWRRTWWELYTICGLVSLIGNFNLRLTLPSDLPLPTSDDQYDRGEINVMGTSSQMQQRFLTQNEVSWSSFAYRVEAMRLLNSVLTLSNQSASEDDFAAVKASITSFLIDIPKDKAEGLKENGDVDEVMSCALMTIHLASICLHIARSDLKNIQGLGTVCGNENLRNHVDMRTRTARTLCLTSAKAIASLFESRGSLSTLSPCFSCAIAFSAVVQLAECRLSSISRARYLEEQLKLQLSTLKVLGETWPVANVVHAQIAQYARQIFLPSSSPNDDDSHSQQLPVIQEPWLQDLLEGEFPVFPDDFTIADL